MRLLVHTSGRHDTLPEAELNAVLAASGRTWHREERHARLLVGRVRHPRGRPGVGTLRDAVSRLGLVHGVARERLVAPRAPDALQAAAREAVPSGARSFRVRAEYADPERRSEGPGRGDVERMIGAAWQGRMRVELAAPERVFEAWIVDERVFIGEEIWTRDRAGFQSRAPRHRPFFSPVSGDPAVYRAVANLARVPSGGLLYDPLVGTGGILIEAGLSGVRVVGSDADPAMMQGARRNLAHAGVPEAAMFVADVRQAPERFLLATGRARADGIATDLPYGQSATTGGAQPADIAAWTFHAAARLLEPGARLVVGAADPVWFTPAHDAGFREVERHAIRVHKSLTRAYSVFVREPDGHGPTGPLGGAPR